MSVLVATFATVALRATYSRMLLVLVGDLTGYEKDSYSRGLVAPSARYHKG